LQKGTEFDLLTTDTQQSKSKGRVKTSKLSKQSPKNSKFLELQNVKLAVRLFVVGRFETFGRKPGYHHAVVVDDAMVL
jgi:hypothetical protein